MAQSCDPNALSRAATCFRCLPDPQAVRTYLLCQWASKPVGPVCAAPTPVATPPTNLVTGFKIDWTCARDPFVNFRVEFGQNAGGPYNDPQSPIFVAANLRTLTVMGLITGNTYEIIVTAVDSISPVCEATSNEVEVLLEG
jgi:hypothetical protein